MKVSTIGGINKLSEHEKRAIYARYIPQELIQKFDLPNPIEDNDLLRFRFAAGASDVEMMLYHQPDFPDPILYAHIADNINGQIHILLYILNDPEAPRFDVDKMPDGSLTRFGIQKRNIKAEEAALKANLSPGQIRQGLHVFQPAMDHFEDFVTSLHHDMYFVEPLYYHNAIIFERHGYSYQMGKRQMEGINSGFQPGGEYSQLLDNSNPFRTSAAADSIRLRSWAIHDGILGEPFTNVTMYKRVGKQAQINTAPECKW